MKPTHSNRGRFKRFWSAAAGGMTVLLAANVLPAAEEGVAAAADTGRDLQSFKIIYERNIFNPNRRPKSAQRDPANTPPPVKVEKFILVGTLISEEGVYAFFDGNESRFRTAVKAANTIAGFKLAEVAVNHVVLHSASNTFNLAMRAALIRQDEGEWKLTSDTAYTESSSSSTNETASTSGGDTGGGDAGADEVLKRLMKQREQEINK